MGRWWTPVYRWRNPWFRRGFILGLGWLCVIVYTLVCVLAGLIEGSTEMIRVLRSAWDSK